MNQTVGLRILSYIHSVIVIFRTVTSILAKLILIVGINVGGDLLESDG